MADRTPVVVPAHSEAWEEQVWPCQFCDEHIRKGEGYVRMTIDSLVTMEKIHRPVHMSCMAGFVDDDLNHHVDELQAMLVDLS